MIGVCRATFSLLSVPPCHVGSIDPWNALPDLTLHAQFCEAPAGSLHLATVGDYPRTLGQSQGISDAGLLSVQDRANLRLR